MLLSTLLCVGGGGGARGAGHEQLCCSKYDYNPSARRGQAATIMLLPTTPTTPTTPRGDAQDSHSSPGTPCDGVVLGNARQAKVAVVGRSESESALRVAARAELRVAVASHQGGQACEAETFQADGEGAIMCAKSKAST